MKIKDVAFLLCFAVATSPVFAQQRLIIVDQDAAGPGGSDMQSILLLLQAPDVKMLGITIVSGDVWASEGVQHTLRMLEIVGRQDVPVFTGSCRPLIRTAAETKIQRGLYGKAWYQGAFASNEEAKAPLKEGKPKTQAAGEDAVHFMVSTVHKYPHQVTIFAGGPMTNIALAVRSDPQFSELAKELVFMGGSLNPQTADPEFSFDPRHEFNLWFDPEAAHIVLTAPWAKITETTVDISLQTQPTADPKQQLGRYDTPAARYMTRYGSSSPYLWDELAAIAWLDPKVVRAEDLVYVDVNLDHGYSYGDTLTWSEQNRPETLPLQKVHVQRELNYPVFEQQYLSLMSHGASPGNIY